jgi:arylsulfatase A-like enzyme
VRFVQLFIDAQIWDNHSQIASSLKTACERTDQPTAALLADLAQRGMLDEVLVLWGGEMGRLPIAQIGAGQNESQAGRDHNKLAMCGWMAGGGAKAGITHGATDELGFAAVEDLVSVVDWHATVLHLLGLDFQKLSYRRNGFDEKLTGVDEAHVVRALLA